MTNKCYQGDQFPNKKDWCPLKKFAKKCIMGKLDREKYVLERAPESNTSLAHTVQRSIVCLSVHGEFSVPLLLYESADDRWTMRH